MIAAEQRAQLLEAAVEAERRLHEYMAGLEPRPDRKSGYVPTPDVRARWTEETRRHAELLAAYRRAARRALYPEPISCGEPREGGCNCTWTDRQDPPRQHVCQRLDGHPPIHRYPEAKPVGGHACRCGVAIPVKAAGVRKPSAPEESAA